MLELEPVPDNVVFHIGPKAYLHPGLPLNYVDLDQDNGPLVYAATAVSTRKISEFLVGHALNRNLNPVAQPVADTTRLIEELPHEWAIAVLDKSDFEPEGPHDVLTAYGTEHLGFVDSFSTPNPPTIRAVINIPPQIEPARGYDFLTSMLLIPPHSLHPPYIEISDQELLQVLSLTKGAEFATRKALDTYLRTTHP